MTLKILAASATIAALTPLAAQADTAANKAFVIEALTETLVNGNVAAVDTYFAPAYIQHNADVPSGTDAFKGLVDMLSNNDAFNVEFVRVIGDGDIVAVHSRYDGFGPEPLVAFDVFRLEDGKIAEHWDNMIAVQAVNPSGRSQLDGATDVTDLDQTDANKAKIEAFITKSLINHEEVNITDYISPVTYIQHNPAVADGIEGFGAFMGQLAEQGIAMEYTKIHQIIGEGNFVLAMSEGAFGGEPQAFFDLFRLDEGLIVEHWDVIAPMPGADAEHNDAGKF
jgi:predicted SnoaL-like aldol condensation-catalyzing enzyme